MTRSHLWGVATILANTFFRECTRHGGPYFAAFQLRGEITIIFEV